MFNNKHYVVSAQDSNVPAHLNFGKYVLDGVRRRNDEVALENMDTGEKMTYKEFQRLAVNLAAGLVKLGVRVGDMVAVGSEKRIEFVPTVLGIVLSGATYTSYLKSGNAVLKHQLTITQPKYFIFSKSFWNTYSDILKSFGSIQVFICFDDDVTAPVISMKTLTAINVDVDLFEPARVLGQTDVAFIVYSSGTTGMPKGVQLTHLNCILHIEPDNNLKNDFYKTVFIAGEWYDNFDIVATFKFLCVGRKLIYVEIPLLHSVLRSIHEHQVDLAVVVPSLVGLICKSDEVNKYNLDSLKIMYSTSSPLHSKTIEDCKKRLPNLKNIFQIYGMTECGEITAEYHGIKGPKPGSVGMVKPGTTLKVVDPVTNEILGPNQKGAIWAKGPGLMKGYIGVESSTYLDEEGFLKTDDWGFYDEDRYFFIVERLKEIICYDGDKIAPIQLETVLQSHPAVKEAAVVGKPVPDFGEEPTAFVVRQPGSNVTEEELVNFVALEVSPYMQLRGGVKFLEEIPRNRRGKILRRRLRELLSEMS